MHFIILGELGYTFDKDFVTLNPITQLRVHFLLLKLCPVVNYLSQRDAALFLKCIHKRLFTSLDLNI